MADQHQAPEHRATIFTDKPKDVATRQWEKEHPGCRVKLSRTINGAVEITYTRDEEVEAARLASEQHEPKKIGTLDGRGGYQGTRYW